jgi:hypothetical protein
MKKINMIVIYKVVFSFMLATAIMLIGCGGSGGGEGRQTLPGENPTGPIIIPGTNTGTYTQTQTGTGTGTGSGTGTGTSIEYLTPADLLKRGWEIMKEGNYGGSMTYFDHVISNSNSTPEQRQQAYNGRGWARAKYYNTIEGLDDFKASYQMGELNTNAYKESILGYALALIQATGDSNFDRAIQLLADELQLANPTFVLGIEHTCIGVSSPEAHAMLAYAYYWRNQPELAKAQINQARVDDSSTTGTVYQIFTTLTAAGLFN